MKKVILFLILIFIYFFYPLFADENISINGMATNGTDVMISVYDKTNSKMYEILYDGKNFEVILKFPINKSELFNNPKINFEPKDWDFYSYFKYPVVVGYFKGKWIFYSPEMLGFFDGRAFTTNISGLYSGCSTASILKFKSSKDIAFIVWSGSTTSCNGEWLCAYYNLPGKNIFPYRQGYYDIAYNSKNDSWYIYFDNFTNKFIYIWKNGKIKDSFSFNLSDFYVRSIEYDGRGDLLISTISSKIHYCGLYLFNNGNLTKISNITPSIMSEGNHKVLMTTNDELYMYNDGKIINLLNFGFKRVDYIIYVNKKGYWLIAGMDKNNTTKLIKLNENSSIEDLTQQLANTTNYNKKIEEIDKEIDEITNKLKELESENPNDERIKIYKQKLEQLIEKRHELKSKNPKYNETLNYIQSEEYWKMQEEIWEYNNRVMKWFIAISILILGIILYTLWIFRKTNRK
ncbi:MAG: hypothetical protein GXN95_02495 [Methanococci archaeon]|nr:hypothetical protein [Methanococci archaeon]